MKKTIRTAFLVCLFFSCSVSSQALFSCLDREIIGIIEDLRCKDASMGKSDLLTLTELYVECVDIAAYEPIALLRNFMKAQVGLLFAKGVIDLDFAFDIGARTGIVVEDVIDFS